MRLTKDEQFWTRVFGGVMVLLLALVMAAQLGAGRPKFVYDYTCPQCHRVITYEDAIPKDRRCVGVDDDHKHSSQKMKARKRVLSDRPE